MTRKEQIENICSSCVINPCFNKKVRDTHCDLVKYYIDGMDFITTKAVEFVPEEIREALRIHLEE